jgi:outer membrane lipoprotein-sorting protein
LRRLHKPSGLIFLIAIVGCAAIALAQSTTTADEIIAKNLAAKGGADKLRAVTSVRTTGHAKSARGTASLTMWTKRPSSMRQEIVTEGRTTVTGFDGTTLWAINPMLGPQAREVKGPAADRAREEASDFDSALLDYKEKGNTVEVVSAEAGAPFHLRVTKKNGKLQDIYLNATTYLEEKVTSQVEQGPRKAIVTTELSNYKQVDGMMVPFTIRQIVNGQIEGEITYERVQFNLPLTDDLFKMPVK